MLFLKKRTSKLNNCKHNSRRVGKGWIWVSEGRSTKNMFDYRHCHSSPGVLITEGSLALGSALLPLQGGGRWG